MSHLIKKMFWICLLVVLVAPAWADKPVSPYISMVIPAQWSPIPGAQGVYYSPGQNLDIFRYNQQYYLLSQGQWFKASNIMVQTYTGAPAQSTWAQTQSIPQVFYQIPYSYFKNPPNWAQGNQTGWGGNSLPPRYVYNQTQWSQVPGIQGVYYAPGQNLDMFRYGQQYYCFNQGQWYTMNSNQNSWGQAQSIPQPFYQIQASYFKNPPGWAKGQKKGWNKDRDHNRDIQYNNSH